MNPKKLRNLCLNCAKEVNTAVAIFCCFPCSTDYKRKQTNLRIETNTGKTADASTIRRYMKEAHTALCSICHSYRWQGKEIPLIVDHINGNPEDNRLENLRLICPNCDAQLPTYKAKNRGNGRFLRRERYKQGKSF